MALILDVADLTKRFGRILAIDRVSLELHAGEILGLVGPNGAGKTTLFEVLAGRVSPDAGFVRLNGVDVTGRPTAVRCRLGIARTFQTPRPFPNMTVHENILVAAVHGGLKSDRDAAPEARGLMELAGLLVKQHELPRNLSFVENRLLELTRAMATNPAVLLVDEIGAGLTATEFLRVFRLVQAASSSGTGVIWVEHALRLMTHCVTRVVVLAHGQVQLQGKPAEVMASPELYHLYLGEEQ